MTAAQLYVLKVIGDSKAPLTIGEVAERTLTDQSTVSVVARRLVDRGILERSRSERDSRRVYLMLTAKGRGIYKKAPLTVANKRLADSLTRLTPSEAVLLQSVLGRIVDDIGAHSAPARMLFDEDDDGSPKRKTRARRAVS